MWLVFLGEGLRSDGSAQLVEFEDSSLHRRRHGLELHRCLDQGAVFALVEVVVDESVVRLAVLDWPQGFVVDQGAGVLMLQLLSLVGGSVDAASRPVPPEVRSLLLYDLVLGLSQLAVEDHAVVDRLRMGAGVAGGVASCTCHGDWPRSPLEHVIVKVASRHEQPFLRGGGDPPVPTDQLRWPRLRRVDGLQLTLSRLRNRAGDFLGLLPGNVLLLREGRLLLSSSLILFEEVGLEQSIRAHVLRPDQGRLSSGLRPGAHPQSTGLVKVRLAVVNAYGLERVHEPGCFIQLVLDERGRFLTVLGSLFEVTDQAFGLVDVVFALDPEALSQECDAFALRWGDMAWAGVLALVHRCVDLPCTGVGLDCTVTQVFDQLAVLREGDPPLRRTDRSRTVTTR